MNRFWMRHHEEVEPVRYLDSELPVFFFFKAEDGIRDYKVTGVQTCALPIYEEITEARRIDDLPLDGSPPKLADYATVEKLATEALANQTKDLQIAAWLTEAWLRRIGFDGLRQGIDLMLGLLEKYWDSLYPEIDEGDLEFRAAPLNWIGSKLDLSVKSVPLAKAGYNWFKYRESREVGYEAAAQDDDKLEARKAALAAKKISAEQFDAAIRNSPDGFYEELNKSLQGCLDRKS